MVPKSKFTALLEVLSNATLKLSSRDRHMPAAYKTVLAGIMLNRYVEAHSLNMRMPNERDAIGVDASWLMQLINDAERAGGAGNVATAIGWQGYEGPLNKPAAALQGLVSDEWIDAIRCSMRDAATRDVAASFAGAPRLAVGGDGSEGDLDAVAMLDSLCNSLARELILMLMHPHDDMEFIGNFNSLILLEEARRIIMDIRSVDTPEPLRKLGIDNAMISLLEAIGDIPEIGAGDVEAVLAEVGVASRMNRHVEDGLDRVQKYAINLVNPAGATTRSIYAAHRPLGHPPSIRMACMKAREFRDGYNRRRREGLIGR